MEGIECGAGGKGIGNCWGGNCAFEGRLDTSWGGRPGLGAEDARGTVLVAAAAGGGEYPAEDDLGRGPLDPDQPSRLLDRERDGV